MSLLVPKSAPRPLDEDSDVRGSEVRLRPIQDRSPTPCFGLDWLTKKLLHRGLLGTSCATRQWHNIHTHIYN